MRTLLSTLALLVAFALGASIAWSQDGRKPPKGEGEAPAFGAEGEVPKKGEPKAKLTFNAEITYAGKTAKFTTALAAQQRLNGLQKQMEKAAKGADAPMDFACKITLNSDTQDFADPATAAAACQRITAAMLNAKKGGTDPATLTIPAEGEFAAAPPPMPMGEGRPMRGGDRPPMGGGFPPPMGGGFPPPMGGFGGVNPNGPPGAQGGVRVGGGNGGNPLGNLPPQLQRIIEMRLRQAAAQNGGELNPAMVQQIIQQTIQQAQQGGGGMPPPGFAPPGGAPPVKK